MAVRPDARQEEVLELVRAAARDRRRATIDEVAQATGMARSSVAYVAKRLGYGGWVELTTSFLQRYAVPDDSVGAISESVELLVSILHQARRRTLLVDAVGDAEIGVEFMLSRCAEAGYAVMPYSYGVVERSTREDAGVLVVLNESGMTLLPTCLHALDHGFQVVAITASHDTPVSKVANVNVVIKNSKSSITEYRPNYFTAGALTFLEKVVVRLREG